MIYYKPTKIYILDKNLYDLYLPESEKSLLTHIKNGNMLFETHYNKISINYLRNIILRKFSIKFI